MLSSEVIKIIEGVTDLSIDEIYRLSPISEKRVIENKTKRKLLFSKKRDIRKTGRGSPLIARRKIRSMENVDEELNKVRW